MAHISLDYSKPSNWDQDKLRLQNVDLHKCWYQGRLKAEQIAADIPNFSYENFNFVSLALNEVTLLKPFVKSKVGLKPTEIDWSHEEYTNIEDDQDISEEHLSTEEISNDSHLIIDYVEEPSSCIKIDNQIMIDGKYYYKASVIRQLFNSNIMSRDRLERVQGMSKYMDETQKVCNLEEVLVTGDPSLVMEKHTILCAINVMKVGGKKKKFLDHEDGDKLIWDGKCIGSEFDAQGKNCRSFQPELEWIDGKHTHVFSKRLMMDIGVRGCRVPE